MKTGETIASGAVVLGALNFTSSDASWYYWSRVLLYSGGAYLAVSWLRGR